MGTLFSGTGGPFSGAGGVGGLSSGVGRAQPDLGRLKELSSHPALANTNAMFGFPFQAMPIGKTPEDWQTWAGQVQNWAKGLGPQVQSWAQKAAPLPNNPFVWLRK